MISLSLRSPTVRFAATTAMLSSANGNGVHRYPFHKDYKMPEVKKKASGDKPTVRLATTIQGGATSPENLARGINHPSVRLAHIHGAQGDNNLIGQRGVAQLPKELAPALLVSYYYLDPFLENKHRYNYRDWVMDSGAFSAHNSGVEIKLDDYIEKCKELLSSDPTLTEVFSLDVIGDWKAGVKNLEKMWKAGVPAIPCFHYGEPWDLLKGFCRDYPKVAIGGCVGKRDKDKFAGQCFARVWPHKLHGFGFGSEKSLMLYPWHSVDATNWEAGPCKFGRWAAFGNASISVRGSQQNLRAEVEWYLELEQKARTKWKEKMVELEKKSSKKYPAEKTHPIVRLAGCGTGIREGRVAKAGEGDVVGEIVPGSGNPQVRLVAARGGGGQMRIDAGISKPTSKKKGK